jgi:hypothetical protein
MLTRPTVTLPPPGTPIHDYLATLPDSAVVCEVGGGSLRKARADWVIDVQPYSARGFIQSADRVTPEQWVVHDVCAPGPWPVADDAFDFTICSHLLEDVYDPFHVVSELMRVSPRGYVETPERAWESARSPYHRVTGDFHHIWLVEQGADGTLVFTLKHGLLDEYASLQIHRRLTMTDHLVRVYWDRDTDPLRARHQMLHGQYEAEFIRYRAVYEGIPEATVRRQLARERLRARVFYKVLRTLRVR